MGFGVLVSTWELVQDSGRTGSRRSNQTLTEKRWTIESVPLLEILWRVSWGMRPQNPTSTFVYLNRGDPGVLNISSATWDCFLEDAAERNMKQASDGHRPFQPPRGPFAAFKSSFYSSFLLFLPYFLFPFPLTKKAALMHFIPGSLRLWRRTKAQRRNLKIKLQTGQLWRIQPFVSKWGIFHFL